MLSVEREEREKDEQTPFTAVDDKCVNFKLGLS